MTVEHAPTPPESISPQEFLRGSTWLAARAPLEATGSRDFGRGYMHAARILADLPPLKSPVVRCALAKSLLAREPSEHVCRLAAAVLVGASLEQLVEMQIDDTAPATSSAART